MAEMSEQMMVVWWAQHLADWSVKLMVVLKVVLWVEWMAV